MFKIGEYGFFFLILFSPPRWTTSKGKDILVSYSAHGKCNFIRQKSTCQRRDIQPHNWSLKWTRAWELSFSEDWILTLNLFERCKRRCFKLSFKRNNIRQHWNLRIHCPFIEIKRSEYWLALQNRSRSDWEFLSLWESCRLKWWQRWTCFYFSWKQKVDQSSFYPSYACFRLATVLTRWQWELKESFLYIFQIVHR